MLSIQDLREAEQQHGEVSLQEALLSGCSCKESRTRTAMTIQTKQLTVRPSSCHRDVKKQMRSRSFRRSL
eukprot:251356-Amphidinium_carterae.1